MSQINTFNNYHLGDNLVHLQFLRKLAVAYPAHQFNHYAPPQHVPQLVPLTEDLPNLALMNECAGDAINAWRGAGNFWHLHAKRLDFVAFHIDWFAHLAGHMGLESPIKCAADMLFDYPALGPSKQGDDHFQNPTFDVLLINSIPHSGQFRGFNTHDFERLTRILLERGKRVITTFPTGLTECTHDSTKGLSVTAIGRLSQSARAIVGVATGPIWPCFNVWNKGKSFVVFLDDERLELGDVEHVRNVEEAMAHL